MVEIKIKSWSIALIAPTAIGNGEAAPTTQDAVLIVKMNAVSDLPISMPAKMQVVLMGPEGASLTVSERKVFPGTILSRIQGEDKKSQRIDLNVKVPNAPLGSKFGFVLSVMTGPKVWDKVEGTATVAEAGLLQPPGGFGPGPGAGPGEGPSVTLI